MSTISFYPRAREGGPELHAREGGQNLSPPCQHGSYESQNHHIFMEGSLTKDLYREQC